MKHLLPLAVVATLSVTACAHKAEPVSDYVGTLRTQSPAAAIVACISEATGGSVRQDGAATIIEAPAAQPPRRFVVSEMDGETTVVIHGRYVDGSAADRAATQCLVRRAAQAS